MPWRTSKVLQGIYKLYQTSLNVVKHWVSKNVDKLFMGMLSLHYAGHSTLTQTVHKNDYKIV